MRTLRICAAAVVFLLLIIQALVAKQSSESNKSSKIHSHVATVTASNSSNSAIINQHSINTSNLQGGTGLTQVAPIGASSIAAMKYLPDGTTVCVNHKVVVWLRSRTFYIEEVDGSAGIRVEVPTYYPTPDSVGNIVSFTGVLRTGFYNLMEGKTSFERYIEVSPADCLRIENPGNPVPPVPYAFDFQFPDNPYHPSSSLAVTPVPYIGLKQKAVGGRPLNSFTPAFPSSIHLNNIGLVARLWGKVTSTDQYEPNDQETFFYIDDGSRLKDGSDYYGIPNVGLRVRSPASCPPAGSFVKVTGVIGTDWWDPTPWDPPVDGEGKLIPVLRTSGWKDITVIDPYAQSSAGGSEENYVSITGRVRANGQTAPGVRVRVYTPRNSIYVDNVDGNSWSEFVIPRTPSTGCAVSFCASGYKSHTVIVRPNESTDIGDIELQPFSDLSIDLSADPTKIKSCSEETVTIKALLRDCEGKGISSRSLSFTTTRGTFVENNQKTHSVTTDKSGVAIVNLKASPDGPGIAQLTASEAKPGGTSKQIQIEFTGITVKSSISATSPPVNGTRVIRTFVFDELMQPMPNAAVHFETTEGGFQEAGGAAVYDTLTSDQVDPLTGVKVGEARVTLVLSQPGTAVVTMRSQDQCNNESVAWTVVSYAEQPWKLMNTGYSNPLVVDLDCPANNDREIAIVDTEGRMHVWRQDGTLLWQTTFGSGISANNTPSAANLDHDEEGRVEIVLPTASTQANVYAYDGLTGIPLAGWPTTTLYVFKYAAAAIGDVNLDGSLEVIAGDESCYVFNWNSTGNWERKDSAHASVLWMNLTGNSGTEINSSTPAIGDIDHDEYSMPEVVVGTNSTPYEVYGFPGDIWGDFTCVNGPCSAGQQPPFYVPGWPKPTGTPVRSSPALGDIDGDGKCDMVIMLDRDNLGVFQSNVDPASGNGKWSLYNLRESQDSVEDVDPDPSVALADINLDGFTDIVAATTEGKVFVFDGQALAQNKILSALDGWEGGIRPNRLWDPESDSFIDYSIRSSPVVGDINDDGKPEIVVGCCDGYVYAFYAEGMEHKDANGHLTGPIAWAKSCIPDTSTSAQVLSSPVIDDVDGDGKVDIVVASTGTRGTSNSGGIYIFHLDAQYHPERMPWPTFHHDNGRSGSIMPVPPMRYGSIVGNIKKNGSPVDGYYVEIRYNDDSPVYKPRPFENEVRKPVRTVGAERNAQGQYIRPQESNRAGYIINQLETNKVYKILVWPKDPTNPQQTPPGSQPDKIITDINIPPEGGRLRLDIDL